MTLHEPDVALTDFLIAIECFALSVWLARRASISSNTNVGFWFVVLFAALGGGALLGGVTHGFMPDEETQVYRWIWRLTLTAIGGAAFACWTIGALLTVPPGVAATIRRLAGISLVLYVGIVFLIDDSFAIAVAYYLPSAFFLFAAFALSYWNRRTYHALAGIVGLLVTFAAAIVQQMEIGILALSLTHNAVYHLIQAPGIALIFVAALGLVREDSCRHAVRS